MILYRLKRLYIYDDYNLMYAATLGYFSASESATKAGKYYRTLPNHNEVMLIIEECDINVEFAESLYEAYFFISDKERQFEYYSGELGLFSNRTEAEECLSEYKSINKKYIFKSELNLETGIHEYKINEIDSGDTMQSK